MSQYLMPSARLCAGKIPFNVSQLRATSSLPTKRCGSSTNLHSRGLSYLSNRRPQRAKEYNQESSKASYAVEGRRRLTTLHSIDPGRCSFVINEGEKMDTRNIISSLETLVRSRVPPRTQCQKLVLEPDTTLSIFATVSQRHLIDEESGLIREIVRMLASNQFAGLEELTVITGLVDRIATPVHHWRHIYGDKDQANGSADVQNGTQHLTLGQQDPRVGLNGAEGITIEWGMRLLRPDIEVGKASSRAFTKCKPGHISVSLGQRKHAEHIKGEASEGGNSLLNQPSRIATITMPLAKTIMSTGTEYVLQQQNWTLSKNNESDPKLLDVEPLESVAFGVSCNESTLATARLEAPGLVFKPLTHARRVEAAFGNVIQSIELPIADQSPSPQIISASTELEQLVNSQPFDLLGNDDGKRFEIWAVVQPSAQDPHVPKVSSEHHDYPNELVRGGLCMYRVHGGGGGWEGKGGPVTLDYEALSESSPALTEPGDELDFAAMQRYLSGADSLVKPGDTVQFYMAGCEAGFADHIDSLSLDRTLESSNSETGDMQGLPLTTMGTLPVPTDRVHPSRPFGVKMFAGFGFLSERAEYSEEVHPGTPGYDTGASEHGRVYSTSLPPGITFTTVPT